MKNCIFIELIKVCSNIYAIHETLYEKNQNIKLFKQVRPPIILGNNWFCRFKGVNVFYKCYFILHLRPINLIPVNKTMGQISLIFSK